MVDQLQDMIAKLTKLKVEELPAIKEGLRSSIDNDTATKFETAVSGALQSAIDAVTESNKQVDQATLAISGEGGMPMGSEADIEQAMDLGGEEGAAPEAPEGEEEMGAPIGDTAAGGEEPLGRSKRESRERRMKAMIESIERKILEAKRAKKKMPAKMVMMQKKKKK
jgi:hypothetical protein